jgi:phosphatidate cytidylyltransferase
LCLKNLLSFWSRLAVTILGTAYVIVAVLWLLHLLAQPEGWKLLYWLLFLVWSTDTTAYIGGRLLKGPKLAPSISPHKTWAGFITGMIGGTIITYITSFWLLPNVFNLWEIIFLVFIAQGGDLLESKAKRWSHVKDSGALIPGHGGLLDRLDSLLAIATTIALWQWFF